MLFFLRCNNFSLRNFALENTKRAKSNNDLTPIQIWSFCISGSLLDPHLQSSPAMWISRTVMAENRIENVARQMEASRRPRLPPTVEEAEDYNSQTGIILRWVFWVGVLAFSQTCTLDISIFKDVAFVIVACVICW